MTTAIEAFLSYACVHKEVVDLRTKSGYTFEKATVNHTQGDAVELAVTERLVTRLYVLVTDQIEWAVRSRSPS